MEMQNNKSLLKDYVEIYNLGVETIASYLAVDDAVVKSWLDFTNVSAWPSDEQLKLLLKKARTQSQPFANHLFSSDIDSNAVNELVAMKDDMGKAGLAAWAERLGGIIGLITSK